jgi:hypothetical protein
MVNWVFTREVYFKKGKGLEPTVTYKYTSPVLLED